MLLHLQHQYHAVESFVVLAVTTWRQEDSSCEAIAVHQSLLAALMGSRSLSEFLSMSDEAWSHGGIADSQ